MIVDNKQTTPVAESSTKEPSADLSDSKIEEGEKAMDMDSS